MLKRQRDHNLNFKKGQRPVSDFTARVP